MSHRDDSSLDAASRPAVPDTPDAARSRQLREEFEAYYAERERRRLTAEALARRMTCWRPDPRAAG